MKNNALLIIIVVLILLLGGWYLYSHSTQAPSSTTVTTQEGASSPAPGTSATPSGGMETGTVNSVSAGAAVSTQPKKEFTVTASNFAFSPKTLTVKKGDHVKITVEDSGGMHDFIIDEFNVHTDRLNTSGTAVVEFDATKAGTFQYYCSVGNHRSMGMWGTLTVTE